MFTAPWYLQVHEVKERVEVKDSVADKKDSEYKVELSSSVSVNICLLDKQNYLKFWARFVVRLWATTDGLKYWHVCCGYFEMYMIGATDSEIEGEMGASIFSRN